MRSLRDLVYDQGAYVGFTVNGVMTMETRSSMGAGLVVPEFDVESIFHLAAGSENYNGSDPAKGESIPGCPSSLSGYLERNALKPSP